MGDAGEGLIDAEARLQERMDELEEARKVAKDRGPKVDPEYARQVESLRLARAELQRRHRDRELRVESAHLQSAGSQHVGFRHRMARPNVAARGALAAPSHLMPVGNAAPPRPTNPAAFTSASTSCGVIVRVFLSPA